MLAVIGGGTFETCAACRRQVVRVPDRKGVDVVIEAEPSPSGVYVVHGSGAAAVVEKVGAARRDGLRAARLPLFEPHSLNCIGR